VVRESCSLGAMPVFGLSIAGQGNEYRVRTARQTKVGRIKDSANAHQRILRRSPTTSKPIAVKNVLGGLHVDYRRAA